MRAKDFLLSEQQELFEIKMSPSNLKKLAKGINAKIGIEYEMIVPDVYNPEYEPELEEDMDMDESVDDIDDIIRFFGGGEGLNSRRDLEELRDSLNEGYSQWLNDRAVAIANDMWEDEAFDKVKEYIEEHCNDDDVIEEFDDEIDPDLFGNKQVPKELWEKYIQREFDKKGDIYDKAKEEFLVNQISEITDDAYSHDLEEAAWLKEEGITDMSDVSPRYNVNWPYFTQSHSEGTIEISEIADEFAEAVGRDTNYSHSYHEGPRRNNEYTVEPDASLSEDSDSAGLEFISPPLSIDETLEDLHKIKKWADEKGCWTDRSTGLHINVSVPDYNLDNLDYVKLTLLLGDTYLLQQFGRVANTYCKSSFDIIKGETSDSMKVSRLFDKLKNNLETIASKTIHTGKTDKFTSINTKDNRVEFRGPGGDWLGKNFSKIEDSIYRCVVALDAACDPTKYREEYLKKLVKMFSPTKGSVEEVFIQYQAGTITRAELRAILRSNKEIRQSNKLESLGIVRIPTFRDMQEGDWIVEYENPDEFEITRLLLKKTKEVNTYDKAIQVAADLDPTVFRPDNSENITVTEYSGTHNYFVFNKLKPDEIAEFYANTPLQAIEFAFRFSRWDKVDRDSIYAKTEEEVEQQDSQESPRMAPGESLYVVKNTDTGHEVRLAAANGSQAIFRATRNDPHNFQGGNSNPNIVVSLVNQEQPTTSNEDDFKLYRVTNAEHQFTTLHQYVAAKSVEGAARMALLIYPQLGNTRDDLDIVLQNSDSETISRFLTRQSDAIEQLNSREPRFPREPRQEAEQSYSVSAEDGTGQVVVDATSSEQAINIARTRFLIPDTIQLIATPVDEVRQWNVINSSLGEQILVNAISPSMAIQYARRVRMYWSPSDDISANLA